jgi:hypothetical protein
MTALHLDVGARRVSAWGYRHPGDLTRSWPGWQLDFRADRFAEHRTVCGRPVIRPLETAWAYAGLRAGLTAADGAVPDVAGPALLVHQHGSFWPPDGSWRYRPDEVTAALAGIDAAERAGSG